MITSDKRLKAGHFNISRHRGLSRLAAGFEKAFDSTGKTYLNEIVIMTFS
jgi:hypothetical protein